MTTTRLSGFLNTAPFCCSLRKPELLSHNATPKKSRTGEYLVEQFVRAHGVLG
jgi:hypothetical protein